MSPHGRTTHITAGDVGGGGASADRGHVIPRLKRCVFGAATLVASVAAMASPGVATAATSPSLTGWNVLSTPIDPMQHAAVPWGMRSDWLQPWRGYLDTPPASMLRDALGMQFNVAPSAAGSTASLLGQVGFERARIEIPWTAMNNGDPTRLDNPAHWDTMLGALKAAGIRPLILLNSHDGTPVPRKTFMARIVQSVPAGARTMVVDAPTAAQIVPGRTGLSIPGGPAAQWMATSVAPGGQVTLSQPVPVNIPAGSYEATTLRFQPFAAPRTSAGAPNATFEATYAGWQSYVKAVTAKARQVLGSDSFDVEIWNELPFGSSFLNAANYYSPVPASLQGTGSVTDELLKRTTQWLRDPANGVPNVGIGNGFANLDAAVAGSTVPVGVSAIDRHPYYGGIKPMPGYAGSIPKIRNVNALGQPEGTQDAAGNWTRPFLPTYRAFFPEYYLNAISTDHMVHDLAPMTTTIGGIAHGRMTKPMGAVTPPQVWITETGFRPNEGGGLTAVQARHVQAKSALRTLGAFVNKGASMMNFYAAGDGDWGMVDMTAPGGGETMVALQRFMQPFAGPAAIATRRSLRLAAVADKTNSTQFTGDGSAAHPTMYNRDVVTFLPFQADSSRFVVPVYVMTRDLAKVQRPAVAASDVTRFDLTQETYRLQIGGLNVARLRVSATDPLTGATVPATVVATSGDEAVVEIPLTDSPRLLVLQDD